VPILKCAKALLPTPGIGSVLICFAGLSVGVVLVSVWGKSSNEMARVTPSTEANLRSDASHLALVQPSQASLNTSVVNDKTHLVKQVADRRGKPSHPHPSPAIFQQSLASDQLGFLTDYAGHPAKDVLREQKVRELMNMVVPYTPFHLGIDMPLPIAIRNVLSSSLLPVQIREGRYVMLSTQSERRGPRGFIWIDMQKGIALGGIFFHPSNGEPTPTLTLFSKQVRQNSLEMSQLPVAFAQDLGQWAATEGIPPITTRYFINASSEKTVLAHNENFCKHMRDTPASSNDDCKQMNAEAADIDMKASSFLSQNHYASNAIIRMAVDSSHDPDYIAR
jgi:hypothetical protein